MKLSILVPSLLVGLWCPAMAAPFVFANGDVVLGFQATSGDGATKNVFFRIGSGTALRDGTISGTLGNIGATLTATFGPNWHNRTDLHCGAFGNLNSSASAGFPFTGPVDGDPSRTVYLTKPATYPRTGEIIAAGTYASSALGSTGTKFSGVETMLPTLTAEADTSAVLNQETQPVEWNNSWSIWNPVPGAAFDTISGGIQQNFGKNTPGIYLDLQRILPTSTGASPDGVVGGGEYVTTISVENDGTIKVADFPSTFYLNNGDVVLGFQATSGEGSTKNVFFRLASGPGLRDGLVSNTLGNIGATLAATYGSNWYSRTDLYCGALGNLNSSASAAFPFTGPVNGDPSRTLYLTKPASFPQEGEIIEAASYASSALGSIGTKFSGMESMLVTLQPQTDFSAVLDQGTQPVEWNNSWSTWNPVPGPSFDTITGGVQQNFGKAGPSTYLDLQRVLATNTGASPSGVVGGGTYETTIIIDRDGTIKIGTTTAYQTWIDGFGIISASDKLTTADADGDGMTNIAEFAFGGSPNNSSDTGIRNLQTVDADNDTIPDLTLTVEVRAGATFTGSGAALTASIDNVSYRVEGSEDLATWSAAVSEVTALGGGSPSAGYVLKTFRLNSGEGLTSKGFLRAGVSN